MPRNSIGNYAPPAGTTPLPNTLGDATKVASYLADLGNEITASVSTDGRTAMTGALTLSGNATAALHAVALQQIQTGGAVQPGGLSAAAQNWTLNGDVIIPNAKAVRAINDNSGIGLYGGSTLSGGGGLVVRGVFAGFNPGGIELYTGGISRLEVKSSGNVGIGTSSPSTRLHVNGGVLCTNIAVQDTSYSLYIDSNNRPTVLLDAGDYCFFNRSDNTLQIYIGDVLRIIVNATGIGGDGSQLTNIGAPVAAIPLQGVGTPITILEQTGRTAGQNVSGSPLPGGTWRCENSQQCNFISSVTFWSNSFKRVG